MLQFNVTASPYNGLIQRCEVNVYGEDGLGRISGNSKLLGTWTTRLNQAKLRVDSFVLGSDGKWQQDDKNHTDLPTITTNLVANQRDYAFTTDENGNVIQEILGVYILNNGIYTKLEYADETEDQLFYDGQNLTGTATKYALKGNTILLDFLPSANLSNGLKIEITREGTYFLTTDTTKTAGYGMYDYVIADVACLDYAKFNTLANVNITAQTVEAEKLEMKDYFSRRNESVRPRLSVTNHNNR